LFRKSPAGLRQTIIMPELSGLSKDTAANSPSVEHRRHF
jgi:hypothetical protein